jgi:pantoate--beta-alanine ligase
VNISATLTEWRERRRALDGRRIGFVPTMGALHRGHAALVERCRRENEITVVSVFVNPAQFNDPRDLERYPRTLERDMALLEELGANEVLAPNAEEIYPQGRRFRIVEEGIAAQMEGAFRPGFFEGVMTVVLKLLNLVHADRAYFGEKDYQQLQIVKDMAADFFIPTEIIACPTVRAESGLAESSRNALLSPEARLRAAAIFRSLTRSSTPAAAKSAIEAEGLSVDYIEEHWGRRFAAARIEGVRLIDNVPLA